VAGALASVLGTLFIVRSASADVRIVNDPGGEVSSYLRTFYEMRATGDRIVMRLYPPDIRAWINQHGVIWNER
jgi:hypothetical protein